MWCLAVPSVWATRELATDKVYLKRRAGFDPRLSKLAVASDCRGGSAAPLCGRALPFRPNSPFFLPLRTARRLSLPAARRGLVSGHTTGKAQPFPSTDGQSRWSLARTTAEFGQAWVRPCQSRAHREGGGLSDDRGVFGVRAGEPQRGDLTKPRLKAWVNEAQTDARALKGRNDPFQSHTYRSS